LKSNNQDTQISIANLINIVINKNINNKGINKNAITKDKRTIITSDNNVTGTVEIETLPITKTHTKDRDQEKEAILIAGIIHMREYRDRRNYNDRATTIFTSDGKDGCTSYKEAFNDNEVQFIRQINGKRRN
jgi:hypothetical protein